jgi:D-tagatose-1,6-bisphosphate aldolase subunit GatZ/KbaZ
MEQHYLKTMALDWHEGRVRGIMSACTASPLCIEAVMREAKSRNAPVLIEATSNQVHQDGGYTGMKPADFAGFVLEAARKTDMPPAMIFLGGDHLGPQPFKDMDAAAAMAKGETMAAEYAAAGFSKLHLDTSMRLGGDSTREKLGDDCIAGRAARLAKAALSGFNRYKSRVPGARPPVFVIGSEVPVPGGAQEQEGELSVTRPEDLASTLAEFEKAFKKAGAEQAWENVIGVVVQPGVEFGDSELFLYDRQKAQALTGSLKNYPGIVFEGHSTDYQTPACLRQLVEDGVSILKVGPALTFYRREALFALSMIEKELLGRRGTELSDFPATLENVMLENPKDWEKYYHGSAEEQRLKIKYSYSDRARYYMNHPKVARSAALLFENLRRTDIPVTLLSQFMPSQADKLRRGLITKDAHSLALSRITDVIEDYTFAVTAS